MMYDSPITLYVEEVVNKYLEQRDNQIVSYITEKYNIDVDRNELVRALNYDRGQYERGYADAEAKWKERYERLLKALNTMETDEIEDCAEPVCVRCVHRYSTDVAERVRKYFGGEN